MQRKSLNAVRRYRKTVKALLACVPVVRKRLLAQLNDSLQSYAEDHPQTDYEELCVHFGTPQQFVSELLASMDGEQLQNELRRYRWRRVLAAIAAVLVLGFVSFRLGRFAINLANQPDTYVIIGPAQEMDGPIPTSPPD